MSRTQDNTAPRVREQDLLQSGGPARAATSSRAGYIPIGLSHVPIPALRGIGVHLRMIGDGPDGPCVSFPLYCADTDRFEEHHRKRLMEHRVKFVYIRMADQSRFRSQTEEALGGVAAASEFQVAEQAMIVYETSVELINELLSEPELVKSPRLEQVSRSITTLVMNTPSSFAHLLAVSHHDFYTATHMVNVATMMVPLAYEMGIRDPDELNVICRAGLVHDIGKTVVPERVLNKRGPLSEADWGHIRRHPEAGCEYLAKVGVTDPLILAVTGEHHERLDGTGYPSGLKGDAMGLVSRICAVVDSFDAMTAFRPFKERTLSVEETMKILRLETPHKYDGDVLKSWVKLLKRAEETELAAPEGPAPTRVALLPAKRGNRRRHTRSTFHCAGRVMRLHVDGTPREESVEVTLTAHSVSRSGLGLLSPEQIAVGDLVRVYLEAPGWAIRPLDGQVVRCSRHSDSWYDIGIEFTTVGRDGVGDVLRAAS